MSTKTNRLLDALVASAKQDGIKDAEHQARVGKALLQSFEKLLQTLPEDKTARLFAEIEAVANVQNQRLIQQHHLRPKVVDGLGPNQAATAPKNAPTQGSD